MSCTPTRTNNLTYQLGRLVSYLLLATMAGLLGSFLTIEATNPIFNVIAGTFIGLMLIWFGIKNYIRKSPRLEIPTFLNEKILKVWGKILPRNQKEASLASSFLVGSFSIFLPCGLLYGVVLALASFDNPLLAMMAISTFWIGTLPAMSFAPSLVKRLINPLAQRMPVVTSVFLVTIGLLTIANRVYASFYATPACH